MDLGTPHLRFDRRGLVGWCVVDNPAQRNTLTMAMYRGLGRVIRAVSEDEDLQALVITGVDDVFIVGGDMSNDGHADVPSDDEMPFGSLYRGEVPVVAAVNGHCQASGVMLTVLADVAVASDRARFRLPELQRGVAATWSAEMLPSVIGLARAKELALTSRPFDAAEAHAIGLVARVVAHDQLEAEAQELAHQLLEAAPGARATWKRNAHANVRLVDEASLAASIATEEAVEGFAAFTKRRPPAWSPRHVATSVGRSR